MASLGVFVIFVTFVFVDVFVGLTSCVIVGFASPSTPSAAVDLSSKQQEEIHPLINRRNADVVQWDLVHESFDMKNIKLPVKSGLSRNKRDVIDMYKDIKNQADGFRNMTISIHMRRNKRNVPVTNMANITESKQKYENPYKQNKTNTMDAKSEDKSYTNVVLHSIRNKTNNTNDLDKKCESEYHIIPKGSEQKDTRNEDHFHRVEGVRFEGKPFQPVSYEADKRNVGTRRNENRNTHIKPTGDNLRKDKGKAVDEDKLRGVMEINNRHHNEKQREGMEADGGGRNERREDNGRRGPRIPQRENRDENGQ